MHVRNNREAIPSLGGSPVSRLRRQLDRLLNDFGGVYHRNSWIPSVDVYEVEDEIRIDFELPGVTREDVDISVENGTLSVSGARRMEWQKHRGLRYHMTERPHSAFFRSVALPDRVDATRITADLGDGVLRVHIPMPSVQPVRACHASRGGSPWRRTISATRDPSG